MAVMIDAVIGSAPNSSAVAFIATAAVAPVIPWKLVYIRFQFQVQGSAAQKLLSCVECDFYKNIRNIQQPTKAAAAKAIPLDDDGTDNFDEFNA